MSQFGNQFKPKTPGKPIRVAIPAKTAAAPAKPPTPAPAAKPPATPAPDNAAKTQPLPAMPRGVPDKPRPMLEPPRIGNIPGPRLADPKLTTYSKVFRWRLPDGQTQEPKTVEVAGSFTHWQRVPLTRDGALDSWHATIHNIQGYKTHHYMLFVDGKPAHDKHADGVAPPHGPQEEKFAVQTPRGPRVFMLFAQAK